MLGNNTEDILCSIQRDITKWFWIIIVPFLIVVGLLSNVVVLLVFRYPRFTRSSMLFHLFVLATNNCVQLCTGFVYVYSVIIVDSDLLAKTDFSCKISYFVLYVSTDFSSWIIVSITYERVFSVVQPLQALPRLTVKKASLRLMILFLLLSAANVHSFFLYSKSYDTFESGNFTGSAVSSCYFFSKELYFFAVYIDIWLNLCLSTMIPFLIIAACNWLIVYTLRKGSVTKLEKSDVHPCDSQHIGESKGWQQTTCICVKHQPIAKQGVIKMLLIACVNPQHRVKRKVKEGNVFGCASLKREAEEETLPNCVSPQLSVNQDTKDETMLGCVSPQHTCIQDAGDLTRFSTVQENNRRRQSIRTSRGTSAECQSTFSPSSRSENIAEDVSRSLLILTIVFFVATFPFNIFPIIFVYIPDLYPCTVSNVIIVIFYTIAMSLFFMHSGANVCFYSTKSQIFREEIHNLFRMTKKRCAFHYLSLLRIKSLVDYVGNKHTHSVIYCPY